MPSDASVVNAAKYKCSKHPSLPLKKTVTPNDCNDLQFVRSVLVIMHFMYTTAISDESQIYTNMRVLKREREELFEELPKKLLLSLFCWGSY